MSEYTGRTPSMAASPGAEVLASRLRADLRMRRVPEGQTREYRAALAQAEAALDTYLGLFYPPDAR
jgi:hypothetical protein